MCAGPATAMGGPASTSPDDLSPDRLALERKAYAKEMGQLFRGKSPTVPRQQGMGKTTHSPRVREVGNGEAMGPQAVAWLGPSHYRSFSWTLGGPIPFWVGLSPVIMGHSAQAPNLSTSLPTGLEALSCSNHRLLESQFPGASRTHPAPMCPLECSLHTPTRAPHL